MGSAFPFMDGKPIEKDTSTLPLYKEIAWDFKRNIPLIENGDFKILEGLEAIKTWVWKALNTERFKYIIYSWDYGNEIETLISKPYTPSYTQAEVTRYVEEALLINPYIKSIYRIESKFNNGKLNINLKLSTVYSDLDLEMEM